MSYIVPGPCNITFNSIDFETTKAGVSIRSVNHDTLIQHDAGGAADEAIIRGGKALLISAVIEDVSFLLSKQIFDGIFGLYSVAHGTEPSTTPAVLPGAATTLPGPIGALASEIGTTLLIQERVAGRGTSATDFQWVAALAVLLDPDNINLASTQELLLACTWLCVPNATTGIAIVPPSYFQA